ncbi:hypothetical protein H0H81_009292 [Sphagnurus paluster]|uniref:NADP-dependent oxidoreductase domain-containing protein n=1 Tax=Sphagnurus paluster TaxID=117069 RepID=A0A9P7GV36_9AGAR|nr:hypothetical protein H0H81_009292 [Sphagnurus paluster]
MSLKSLPTRTLGKNGPTVSALGLGAMGIGAFYGSSDETKSQTIIGKWFAQTGRRSEIFLATKFGSMDLSDGAPDPYKANSKPRYIAQQLSKSLAALQTDYVDLYYQHRVDPEVPIEVVLEALRPFVESGKIKWIGLSEPSVKTLRRAKAVEGVGAKVVAVQMEFSPFELSIEKNGFLEVANENGMAVVAYSPLARGLVTGRWVRSLYLQGPAINLFIHRFRSPVDFEEADIRKMLPRFSEENFSKNLKVVDELKKIGEKYDATTSQIALAWILAEHPNFIPIPGIRSVERLEENARGAELSLSAEDVKAIRKVVEAAEVAGERYPDFFMPQGDCIELSEWKGE